MKREDVEALLAKVSGMSERGIIETPILAPHLAALCRRWLAVEDCTPVRITGCGKSWTGGGTTALTVDGCHDGIELLAHYRIVPEQGEVEGG